jgi:hypothetical protein
MLQLLGKFVEAGVHFAEFVAARGFVMRFAGAFRRSGFADPRLVGVAAFARLLALRDGCGIGFVRALVTLVMIGGAVGRIVAPGLARRGVTNVTIRVVFALGFVRALITLVAIGIAERFGLALPFVAALVPLVAIRTAFVTACRRFVAVEAAKRTAFV